MEKRTILIVDDDIAIGSLEQVILTRAGYAVRRAYSGTEASLFLRANRPDLVLHDLMLPGLSGEELLLQMQGISVIVVSAKAAVEDNVSTERLFDRFFTVRGARGSTGLGLSIAGLLTERMGGTVQAEWHAGRLTVRVRFPSV